MEEHDEQVENFAEDEPAKIYVVPENRQISFFEHLTLKPFDNDWLSYNLLVGDILSEKCN